MNVVNKEELDAAKRIIENEVSNLESNVKVYNSMESEISAVINKLRSYYNTSGGKIKVAELENIDFSFDELSKILSWASSLNCEYDCNGKKYL